MNYELILKLKDAGFVFNSCVYVYVDTEEDGHNGHLGHCASCSHPAVIINNTHYILPTIEELIDACGDKFASLKKMPDIVGGWYAYKTPESEDSLLVNTHTYGSTPPEAVANLWLSLNKK